MLQIICLVEVPHDDFASDNLETKFGTEMFRREKQNCKWMMTESFAHFSQKISHFCPFINAVQLWRCRRHSKIGESFHIVTISHWILRVFARTRWGFFWPKFPFTVSETAKSPLNCTIANDDKKTDLKSQISGSILAKLHFFFFSFLLAFKHLYKEYAPRLN